MGEKALADVDGDGQITIDDATHIQFFPAFFDHYSSTGESFDGAQNPVIKAIKKIICRAVFAARHCYII